MLWAQMKEDDFDTDIVEILKEDNSDIANQLKGLSRNDFSEVYLFLIMMCIIGIYQIH